MVVELIKTALPTVEKWKIDAILVEKLKFLVYTYGMEELEQILAQNIVKYRTASGLTQLDLAEALNYSDKSISKWERGNGVPDVIVLKKMADLFGVKVDDLLTKHDESDPVDIPNIKALTIRRLMATLLSCGLVWLIATLVYVVLNMVGVAGAWRSFIYAIPVTMIVATVFSALWANRLVTSICVSLLVWSILISVYITFIGTKAWLLFFIGIPMQILIIFFAIFMKNKPFFRFRPKNKK